MSLVPDYDTSDSSAESELDEDISKETVICDRNEINYKLPTPEFICDKRESTTVTKSIFTNPFAEAENAEAAKLERHVKMVNKTDNLEMINGKKVCWNHRKGKCHFGHNCKYAHDTELQKSIDVLQREKQIGQTILCQKQETSINDIKQMQGNKDAKKMEGINDIKQMQSIVKRKRPGLTKGLVPSKKVMKTYFTNK